MKQVRAHTHARTRRDGTDAPGRKRESGVVDVSATGRDGTEGDGECQVCHASETFAWVSRCEAHCGARCVPIPAPARARASAEASEAIMYTGTTAALGYCRLQTPTRPLHATRMRRVLLALIRRLLKGRLLTRHSRGSLRSADRPKLALAAVVIEWVPLPRWISSRGRSEEVIIREYYPKNRLGERGGRIRVGFKVTEPPVARSNKIILRVILTFKSLFYETIGRCNTEKTMHIGGVYKVWNLCSTALREKRLSQETDRSNSIPRVRNAAENRKAIRLSVRFKWPAVW